MHSVRSDRAASSSRNAAPDASHVLRFDAPSFSAPTSREAEATRIRDVYSVAEAEGRAAGFAAGMAEAEAELSAMAGRQDAAAAALVSAAEALRRAAEQLADADRLSVADVEHQIVHLALDLAATIVGREVQLAGSAVDAVRAAAGFVPERQAILVRVNPADAGEVSRHLPELALPVGSEVVADPAIGRGQCVLDAGMCRVDHQVSGALDRMRAAVDEFYNGQPSPAPTSDHEVAA